MITVDAYMIMEVEKRLKNMSKKASTVIMRSLNRSVDSVVSDFAKRIASDYHIIAKNVKQTVKVRKATTGRLSAEIKSAGRITYLDKFKYTPKKPQPNWKKAKRISAAVKKEGGLKEFVHAFVANINGIKVFERTGKKTESGREEIKRLPAPSIPGVMSGVFKTNQKEMEQAAKEKMAERLEYEIDRILKRGAK